MPTAKHFPIDERPYLVYTSTPDGKIDASDLPSGDAKTVDKVSIEPIELKPINEREEVEQVEEVEPVEEPEPLEDEAE